MASHHSDDEENEVSDSEVNDIPSYDELQNASHKKLLKLSRKCSKKILYL